MTRRSRALLGGIERSRKMSILSCGTGHDENGRPVLTGDWKGAQESLRIQIIRKRVKEITEELVALKKEWVESSLGGSTWLRK